MSYDVRAFVNGSWESAAKIHAKKDDQWHGDGLGLPTQVMAKSVKSWHLIDFDAFEIPVVSLPGYENGTPLQDSFDITLYMLISRAVAEIHEAASHLNPPFTPESDWSRVLAWAESIYSTQYRLQGKDYPDAFEIGASIAIALNAQADTDFSIRIESPDEMEGASSGYGANLTLSTNRLSAQGADEVALITE